MKDTFCAYYTNSKDINSYMVARLEVSENDIILEPSAGEGVFIDEILNTGKAVQIDALDINGEAISILQEKYDNNPAVVVRETDTLFDEQLDVYGIPQLWLKQTDTLLDEQLNIFGVIGGHYSKVIGNPPYGAWQNYEKRDLLKKKYPGHYVKETYSLFLLRCISVLKIHGRLSFIIPDTYLFLNMHTRLREFILTKTKIDEIIIFPTKFFPGVNFGYSNLSIITLERCETDEALENTIKVVRGFKSSSEFEYLLSRSAGYPEHLSELNFKQKDILANNQHRFVLAEEKAASMLTNNAKTLGDVANVVTGFYTGNNTKFVKAKNKDTRGAKEYEIVDTSRVYDCLSIHGILNVEEGYVPYIKSAPKHSYVRENDDWFVRWDYQTIDHYKRDKKARFQNSAYYFKAGVGIPMVKSSRVRAFLMKERVFDQSIVGIFPKDDSKLYYILALMNSETVNNFIHVINPTANNSANYIKQIPYIEPDEESLNKITRIVEGIIDAFEALDYNQADRLHSILNCMIAEIYE